MQAVILAAGQSSRFFPYNTIHKSLVTIAGKTILEHTLLALKTCGITSAVVIGSADGAVEKIVNEQKIPGLSCRFVLQPKPLGAGNALLLCKEFLEEEFLLLNASHVDADEFVPLLKAKKDPSTDLVLLAKEETALQQYGILRVEGEKVVDIVEKPAPGEEPSNLRVIGIYLMTRKIIVVLEKTPSEHYQLEAAIGTVTKEGEVHFAKTDKEIVTLKYPWDLLAMKNYLLRKLPAYISPNAKIAENVQILGNVYIDDAAIIMEGACLKGPCYIGKHAFVGNNAVLRNGSSIEENAVAGSMLEMKNVLLMENSTTHTGLIEDSIIGKNCKIAAGICTANVRLDRKTIPVIVKGEQVNSHLTSLGIMIGENVKTGIKVATMPGVIIGTNSLIGPSTTVMKNVQSNVKYYTKFQEIIEENI